MRATVLEERKAIILPALSNNKNRDVVIEGYDLTFDDEREMVKELLTNMGWASIEEGHLPGKWPKEAEMDEAQKITHDCWLNRDWVGRSKNQWLAYPGLQEKIISTLTGEQFVWRVGLVDRLAASKNRPARVLELGCGKQPISLQLTAPAEIVMVDLVDFKFEERSNVIFKQLNLNEEFAKNLDGTFDLIIVSHVAHHIQDQDNLTANTRTLLKDDGLLFLDDYIGPRWLVFDEGTLAIGRNHLLKLPESKRSLVEGGVKTNPWHGGNEAAWAQIDPSEACSSDTILPAFMQHFVPTNYWAGGTLLYMVLEFISQNFPDNQESKEYLDNLWSAERALILTGQLEPWFAMMIAQKRRVV